MPLTRCVNQRAFNAQPSGAVLILATGRAGILRLLVTNVRAITPPLPAAPPAINAAVAMHTGHIGLTSRWNYTTCAACCMNEGASSALGPQLAGTAQSSSRR